MVEKVFRMILEDRRLKLAEIAEIVRTLKGWADQIFHQILGIRKLSASWVLGLLTSQQKLTRKITVTFEAVTAQFNGFHAPIYNSR